MMVPDRTANRKWKPGPDASPGLLRCRLLRRRPRPYLDASRRGAFRIYAAIALSALLLAPALFPGQFVLGQERENPYWVIIDRNPFDLQDPPVAPPVEEKVEEEPEIEVDVKLTGFSMFGDVAQVYLMIPPDKENPNPRFLTLAEGDAHDGIDVLSIDPANEMVRIRNAGVIAQLTFESHGLKTAAAPAKPSPSSRGRTTATSSSRARITPTASRSGRSPSGVVRSGSNASISRSGGASGAGTTSIPTRQIPRRNLRTYTSGSTPSPEYESGGDAIAVRQILQVEAQRAANPNLQLPPMPGIPGSDGGPEGSP